MPVNHPDLLTKSLQLKELVLSLTNALARADEGDTAYCAVEASILLNDILRELPTYSPPESHEYCRLNRAWAIGKQIVFCIDHKVYI